MPFPEYFNEIKPVDDYALGKSELCRETRLPSMILSFLQMYPEAKEDRSLVISGSFLSSELRRPTLRLWPDFADAIVDRESFY